MPPTKKQKRVTRSGEPRTPDRSWTVFYNRPTIEIDVGDGNNRETFTVARDVLTTNSPVFPAMLEGRERGGGERRGGGGLWHPRVIVPLACQCVTDFPNVPCPMMWPSALLRVILTEMVIFQCLTEGQRSPLQPHQYMFYAHPAGQAITRRRLRNGYALPSLLRMPSAPS